MRVRGGARDRRTPGDVVFGPTFDPDMGENGNADATGILLCLAGHQSFSCTANEEDSELADGLGETADVQPGKEAGARLGGLSPLHRRPGGLLPLYL